MILSAQSIRMRVTGKRQIWDALDGAFYSEVYPDMKRLAIDPFCERAVAHGKSYGLSSCGYDLRIKDAVRLVPGEFALATTVERLELPPDLMGQLVDKSSWARFGLAVQNTVFEPGWRGYPTIELSNHSKMTLQIEAACPIAQMIFHVLDESTEAPYAGKYQDQPQEPVEAIEEASRE